MDASTATNAVTLDSGARQLPGRRQPFLRFDALRWFTGLYFVVLGASFLILPPPTIGRPSGGLELRGALLVIAGVSLLWAVWGGFSPRQVLVLHVVAAIPSLWVAAEYAAQGALPGASLLGLIGAALLLAAPFPQGEAASRRPDALGLVLGGAEAAFGIDLLTHPELYSPVLSVLGLSPAGMGWTFVVGGAAVVASQLLGGSAHPAGRAAHVFAGAALLVYWLSTALADPLYWALGAAMFMRGVAVGTLPWWSERIRGFDSRSIRAQLMVGFATASLVPLLIAVPVILNSEQDILSDDPATFRKLSFAVALLIGTVAVLTGGWLATRLTRSLQNLARRAGQIAEDGARVTFPKDGPAEVVQLGQAMEAMAAVLARRAAEREDLLEREQTARGRADLERVRLRQLLDSLPEAVLMSGADGQIAYLNQPAMALLGLDSSARPLPGTNAGADGRVIVRRADGSVYATDDLPLRRALYRGEIVLGEREIIRDAGSGRDVPILVNASPIRDPGGAIVGSVAVFQDVSAIDAFEQARDAFFAAISHDLKNPLAGIRGTLQLLRREAGRETADTETLTSRLDLLLTTTDRMNAILDDLVDLTQLQAGQPMPLRVQPVDLTHLIRTCVEAHQRTTDRHQLMLTAPAGSLWGMWDGSRLGRAVDNLLNNAIKYSPDGGAIAVDLSRHGNEAVLVVRDEGDGISADDLSTIFLPFKRGADVAQQVPGQGLGLTSVRRIIEQQHGTVEAASAGVGKGSTFTVRLPIDNPDGDSASGPGGKGA